MVLGIVGFHRAPALLGYAGGLLAPYSDRLWTVEGSPRSIVSPHLPLYKQLALGDVFSVLKVQHLRLHCGYHPVGNFSPACFFVLGDVVDFVDSEAE